MPAVLELAARHQIAVRQQAMIGRVRLNPHGIAGKDVRSIGEVGDLAKPFSFALGAKAAAGHVEPFQRLIAFRIDLNLRLKGEGGGDGGDGEMRIADLIVSLIEDAAVDGGGD
jgi:hypothetical protein